MKRFVLRLLVFLSPVLLLGLAQYLIDPLDLYPGVQLLPYVPSNPRAEKLAIIQSQPPGGYDALILGSSRSMRMPTDVLADYGYNAFNWAVYNAKAEDLYAILRYMVEQRGNRLRLLVIGLEPRMFHPDIPVQANLLREDDISEYIVKYLGDIHQPRVSIDAVQRSIEKLPDAFIFIKNTKNDYYDNHGNDITVPHKNTAWFISYFPLLPELINTIWARQYLSPPNLSPQRLVLFNKLVEYCRENDIKIVAALTPYAPEYTAFLDDFTHYPEWISAVEAVLDEYSSSSFTWNNLLDVSIFNGRAADFIDYNHMNDANSQRFLEWLMAQTHRR